MRHNTKFHCMKTNKKGYYLFAISFLACFGLKGQTIIEQTDSLVIEKIKSFKSIYKLNHPDLKEISIFSPQPKAVTKIPKKFWGNMAEGAITLFSGFGTGSSEDAIWITENRLITTNLQYTWDIPLYFPGTFSKDRARVRNEDGSTSIETRKGIFIDWKNGAEGFIIEKKDTIGRFSLETDILDDAFSNNWIDKISIDGKYVESKLKKYRQGEMNYHFRLKGTFRDNEFCIINHGNLYRSLIFINGKPVAIYQSEPDFIILKKKDRVHPFILTEININETMKTDLYRLAFLSNMIAKAIRIDFYEM